MHMRILDWVVGSVGRFFAKEAEIPMREAAGGMIDGDEQGWRLLGEDSGRNLSPMTQDYMQDLAFYLWESNPLANRIIELPLAFLLGEGVKLSMKGDEAVIAEQQAYLDSFWNDPINEMDIKLTKKLRELSIFGEQCYPVYVNEANGHVRLGYLDPKNIAHVVMDPDNPEQAIGVVTKRNAKHEYKKLRIIINGDESVFTERTRAIRENDFKDGEAFYFAINNISCSQRGRSDLLTLADFLDAYDKLMFGEFDRIAYLRAFVWDLKVTGATPDQITERMKKFVTPGPNSAFVHNESEELTAKSPDVGATENTESSRMFRNHILGGKTLPGHWYADGGDANRAIGAEMGEPTFKMLTMRQKEAKYMLQSIGKFVLRQKYKKAHSGLEPDMNDPEVAALFKVEAIFPEMAAKDTTKYAAALQQVVVAVGLAIDKKLMDIDTGIKIIGSVANGLGITMDEKIIKEAIGNAPSADLFTTPPEAGH